MIFFIIIRLFFIQNNCLSNPSFFSAIAKSSYGSLNDYSSQNKQMRHDELFRLYLVFQEMRIAGVQVTNLILVTVILFSAKLFSVILLIGNLFSVNLFSVKLISVILFSVDLFSANLSNPTLFSVNLTFHHICQCRGHLNSLEMFSLS